MTSTVDQAGERTSATGGFDSNIDEGYARGSSISAPTAVPTVHSDIGYQPQDLSRNTMPSPTTQRALAGGSPGMQQMDPNAVAGAGGGVGFFGFMGKVFSFIGRGLGRGFDLISGAIYRGFTAIGDVIWKQPETSYSAYAPSPNQAGNFKDTPSAKIAGVHRAARREAEAHQAKAAAAQRRAEGRGQAEGEGRGGDRGNGRNRQGDQRAAGGARGGGGRR